MYVAPTKPVRELLDPAIASYIDFNAPSISLIIRSSESALTCELKRDEHARCRWFTPKLTLHGSSRRVRGYEWARLCFNASCWPCPRDVPKDASFPNERDFVPWS